MLLVLCLRNTGFVGSVLFCIDETGKYGKMGGCQRAKPIIKHRLIVHFGGFFGGFWGVFGENWAIKNRLSAVCWFTCPH